MRGDAKSDDYLEELLLLTEQMKKELDQKDQIIRELKVRLKKNKRIVAERKRENANCSSYDRGMSR